MGYNNGYLKSAIIAEAKDGNARANLHFALDSDIGSGNVGLADAKMTITYDGNVGIGTSSPSAALDVVGVATVGNGTYGVKLSYSAGNTSGIIDTADSADKLEFRIANSEKMRIDSSGNLLFSQNTVIGQNTSDGSDDRGVFLCGGASQTVSRGGSVRVYGNENAETGDVQIYSGNASTSNITLNAYGSSSTIQFTTNGGSERMRIDASGSLLVGVTAAQDPTTTTTNGHTFYGGTVNAAVHSRANDNALAVQRTSSDGEMINFFKDTAQVGSIGAVSGGGQTDLFIGSDNVALWFGTGTSLADTIAPATTTGGTRTDAINLGNSVSRFKDLYLSGGVYLGGTGAANKLDDYEEGTWTPTLAASTTNPTPTYTKQQGTYTKVGDIVHASVDLRWSAFTGGSGNLQISGLPFTTGAQYWGGTVFEHSGSFAYNTGFTTFGFENIQGASKLGFLLSTSSSSTIGYNIINLGTGTGYVIFSFSYKVA